MRSKIKKILLFTGILLAYAGYAGAEAKARENPDTVTEGTEEYRGFLLDNVLHSEDSEDIHYNLYVPDSYDGSEPYALFFTLPGYEGLYFQGVGENLYSENFGFEAQDYIEDMIIAAPSSLTGERPRQIRRSLLWSIFSQITILMRRGYLGKAIPAAGRRCPS